MIYIARYALVSREGEEGDLEYEDFNEAKEDAGKDHAVIERRYEYADSGLVWTPDGSSHWPPKGSKK